MPLITARELLAGLDDEATKIIDCRWYLGKPGDGAAAYAAGHIPGAIYADLESDLSGPQGGGRHPLPSPGAFDMTLRKWGVSSTSRVVAYDDRGGAVAARLWWMLTQQGHRNTFVLDGGLHRWREAGGPITTDVPTEESDTERSWIEISEWTGTVDQAGVAHRHEDVVLADARGADRYRGDNEPVDPVAGHIPGAVSFPMTSNLDGASLKIPNELRSAFSKAGIGVDTPVIMYCGSGVNACHNILAMEIAGLGRPALYVGSWSDWSSSKRPVAVGSESG